MLYEVITVQEDDERGGAAVQDRHLGSVDVHQDVVHAEGAERGGGAARLPGRAGQASVQRRRLRRLGGSGRCRTLCLGRRGDWRARLAALDLQRREHRNNFV